MTQPDVIELMETTYYGEFSFYLPSKTGQAMMSGENVYYGEIGNGNEFSTEIIRRIFIV